ncbi:hypothetical protein [Amycolatopsis sp. NPDC059657]|uniref:hypothetical protein n=1 Tax=Amycolatopsis sp. NPDC059657 TaxID=3346899 RepID=UPI00366AD7A7
MNRPRSRAATSPLGAALGKATRAAEDATRRYLDPAHSLDPATMSAENRQLVLLLGALAEFTTALAAHLGPCADRFIPRADDNHDPRLHVAHACRGLAELRHHLDLADQAGRDVYTALSHLDTQPDPART